MAFNLSETAKQVISKFDHKKVKANIVCRDGKITIEESQDGRYTIHLWDNDRSGNYIVGDVVDTEIDLGAKAVELLSSYLSKELSRIEKEYGIGLLWAKPIPLSNDRESPIELAFYNISQ